MKNRQLGNTGVYVPEIGLGCMGMSAFYGPIDHEEVIATLLRAVELGVTFIDTADMYGNGANESLLGQTLKPYLDKLTIATKFGFVSLPPNPFYLNGRPEYVKEACEKSLKRLGIETIDLYYLHRVDPNIPIEDTVGAMAKLVQEGKVKYLGLSEVNSQSLKKAHAIHPITAVQSEYSLWSRDPEKEIIPLCEALNISFIPYSPLGRGFLTNKLTSISQMGEGDFRSMLPRYEEENARKNGLLVQELTNIAETLKCTPAQLSLAWILKKSPRTIPIPGTRHRKYLEENVASASFDVSQDIMDQIDTLFKPEMIAGKRHTDDGMKLMEG
ncbi:MAG: aldo/keto reductase [Alphaproteobacteria bacterium]|jgi:aryl-alcohol dehydrogenase-like predicted oxidoreductase|nr:aldo/keto reductase [Alphaproteobacteria bacterium]